MENENDQPIQRKALSFAGKLTVGVVSVGVIGSFAVTLPFILPAIRRICLPYVPATYEQVTNILKALKGRSGALVDLGSGDGRIVIEVARKQGLICHGVELNPWLVWYSRVAAWKAGVGRMTKFHTRDLWKVNLGSYENIVIFGVEQMMAELEVKVAAELPSDGCVVACRFAFPEAVPTTTIGHGIDTVWCYSKDSFNNKLVKYKCA